MTTSLHSDWFITDLSLFNLIGLRVLFNTTSLARDSHDASFRGKRTFYFSQLSLRHSSLYVSFGSPYVCIS